MKRFALVLAIVGAAQIAEAAPDKTAGQIAFAAGKELYAKGDYLGAATKFALAYDKDPDPAYIFNAGQAYRRRAEQKAGSVDLDCARSARAYQIFLRLVPASPNRSEVETYVIEMNRCAGTTTVPEESTDKPPVDKPPVDRPPVDRPPIDKPPIDKPIDKPDGAHSPLKAVGIVVGGVGLVAVGGGIYYASKASDLANERDELRQMGILSATKSMELDDKGHSLNVKQGVFFAIGGAAVVTGVVLYFAGRRATRDRLTIAPTRGGATLLVRF